MTQKQKGWERLSLPTHVSLLFAEDAQRSSMSPTMCVTSALIGRSGSQSGRQAGHHGLCQPASMLLPFAGMAVGKTFVHR